jgi:catechol 2,3-dioxygenase-like lactoylglutathione lyase family enzyme
MIVTRSRFVAKVKGIDHLSLSVRNFKKSKVFYDGLLKFLGFMVLDEYDDSIGWTNKKTRLWISEVSKKRKRHKHHIDEVGFNHYAFRLDSKKSVYDLEKYLKSVKAKITDPAGEYYDNYFGVYFKDPDGMKLEGMWYGD